MYNNYRQQKGGTVAVKMGPIINSGHELKQFSGARGLNSLLTFGADGHVVLRMSDVPPHYGKTLDVQTNLS